MFKLFYNVLNKNSLLRKKERHIRTVDLNGWSMSGGEGEMAEGEKRRTLTRYKVVTVALSVTIL